MQNPIRAKIHRCKDQITALQHSRAKPQTKLTEIKSKVALFTRENKFD